MGGFLKNLLVSAVVVVGGTAATTGVACLALLIAMSTTNDDYAVLLQGGAAIVMAAVAIGIGFSFVSLFVAAFTMPVVIGLARAFKLPRPVTDMIGGGAAGWLCAVIALEGMESLVRAKGGAPPDAMTTYLLMSCGVLGGCLTGYWRHSVLVRAPIQFVTRPAVA